MSRLKTIIKQSTSISFIKTGAIFVSFINVIIFTHFLSPEVYGNYILARTFIMLSGLFSTMGLTDGLLRQGSIALGKKNHEEYLHIQNYSFSLSLLIGIIFCLALLISSYPLAVYIYKNKTLFYYLLFFCFLVPLLNMTYIIRAIQRVLKKADISSLIELLLYPGCLLITFLISAIFLKEESLAIIAFVSGNLLFFFIVWFFPGIKTPRFFFKLEKEKRNNLFKIAIPMFAAQTINQSQRWLDKLLLGVLSTVENVGIYFVGIRIAQFINMPLFAFTQIFIPVAGRLIGKKKHDELNKLYKSVTLLILIFGIFIFGTIYFLKEYIFVFFHEDYIGSMDIIIYVLIGEFINICVGSTRQLTMICGGAKINLINSVLMVVITFILCFIFIPPYQMTGAAIAYALSRAILNIINVTQLIIIYKLSPFSRKYFFSFTFFLATIAGLYCIGLPYLLCFFIFIVLNIVFNYFLILGQEEKEILAGFVQKLKKKKKMK
jgi:O-antigen/teichoic acid export membrane protein